MSDDIEKWKLLCKMIVLLFDIAFGGWDNDVAEAKALLHTLYHVLRLLGMAFREADGRL